MRYFDTILKVELIPCIHDLSPETVAVLDDDNVFFKPIPDGKIIEYDASGIPVSLTDEPPKTADQIRHECLYLLEKKRRIEQSSGVIVNGVDMQTDAASIAKMDQYATESMTNGIKVVYWQKEDGTFYSWDIADFKKMFSEVTLYENACFKRQSELLDEINVAPDPATVDISIGWPSKTITFV